MKKKSDKKKIVILTGGTAGHVYPCISIYNELIKLNWEIYWIINDQGLKFLLKEKIYKNVNVINFVNFRKINFIQKIFSIFKFIRSINKTRKILIDINPNVVMGTGGYFSFPGCLSSWINNIPLILYEQNYILGLSNKILSNISNVILQGFNNSAYKKTIFTGNPIRNSILNIKNLYKEIKLKKGPIRILILGGSQGSNFINDLVIDIFSKLNINILIWHQVGNNKYNYIYSQYYKKKITKYIYKIEEFIFNISNAYKWSDLLISRSGALIVSEVLFIGLPSIFIPFLHKDKHQYFNALYAKEIGLSEIIEESKFTKNILYKYLFNLNREKLFKMSINIKKIKKNNPIKKIINYINKFSKK